MATIFADFDAETIDGRIRLSTVGSRRSLQETGAQPGDWVWLSDGELRVGGRIEEENGRLLGRPAWETLEEIDFESDDPGALEDDLQRFREWKERPERERDYRLILRILPKLELVRATPGQADLLRARAALSFGYPELALLAIEDALQEKPEDPALIIWRLIILQQIDEGRAFLESERLIAIPGQSALILAICIRVFGSYVPKLRGEEALQLVQKILDLTSRVELAPGRGTLPDVVVTFVDLVRRLALKDLGEEDHPPFPPSHTPASRTDDHASALSEAVNGSTSQELSWSGVNSIPLHSLLAS